MHICFLCNEYPPGRHGGVGSFTQTLGRALVERGHEVSVVGFYSVREESTESDRGVRVIRLPGARIPGTGFLVNGTRLKARLAALHRESPIDLLEGTEIGLSLLPAGFPASTVIRMHGGHQFFTTELGLRTLPWKKWLENRSFRRADHLCAVSRYVADTTRDLLRLGDRPVEVIPNSVDLSLFNPTAGTEESGLILFVGTVCEKKGIRQLVQAMPQVLRAHPDARLWIAGRDGQLASGGSFTAHLQSLIGPELKDRISFLGVQEHSALPALMSKASVCAYPSHMEALPVAWLEGMAMGKAIVASATGPGPELIEDGVTGLLCDPKDPSSIADKLVALLSDRALRARLGSNARARTEEFYSSASLVGKNEAFYRRCLGETAIHG